MKYLKTFESKNTTAKKFKPGDLVIISKDNYKHEIIDFLNNNIGEIYNIEHNKYDEDYFFYNIRYNNVPKELFTYTRYMGTFPTGNLKSQGEIFTATDNEIRLATSEDIEDYNLKNTANKYNL